MKYLLTFVSLFLSLNSFAAENGRCSDTALNAVQSIGASNNKLTTNSHDVKRMTVSYRGETTAGSGTYCSVLKEQEYCVRMNIIDGNVCQVAGVEVSGFSF